MHGPAWRLLAIFGGFTALAVFLAVANYLTYLSTSGVAYWSPTLKRSLADWWLWAALTPPILQLAARFPIQQSTVLRNGAIHVVAMVVIGVAKLLLDHWIRRLMFGSGGYLLFTTAAFNFLVYWAIVAAAHGIQYYRTGRQRELQSAQLEAKLADTRLQLLNMQLQPHFLFNTLNTISELVHEDPETADRMISGLSTLLRETLNAGTAPAVSLEKELQLLKCYIEIQQTRFGRRLDATIDADRTLLNAAVPVLLLQTIVENAIRHGLAKRGDAGRIGVAVSRDQDRVTMTVRDDGDGLTAERREGIGIGNTRARLQGLFGTSYTLEVSNAANGGALVTISFPYRPVDQAAVN
jgi:two-component system LytT family sensor kinase